LEFRVIWEIEIEAGSLQEAVQKAQQNIQTELNFSSTPAGEAREAGREETC
jgi:hypothetical protein